MEQEQQQNVEGEVVSTPKKEGSMAWATYLLGWITGLYFFLTTKDSFVKFHAAQSIVLFGGLHVLSIVLRSIFGFNYYAMVSNPILGLVNLLCLVLWIFLMVKAHQGEKYSLPIVGEFAEKLAKK